MKNQEMDCDTETLPAVQDHRPPANVLELMDRAIDQGADPAYLDKLLDVQERYEKGIAEKAYFAAMNAVQAEMQPIVAKHFNTSAKNYYAKLREISAEIKPIYIKHGFSISFSEGDSPNPDEFRTYAFVMHTGGHKDEHHIDLEIDNLGPQGKPNKTKVQGKGSSITYARRYLLLSIFDIQIEENDNDGNSSGQKFASLSLDEINHLKELVKAAGVNVPAFFKAHNATGYEDFPKNLLQKAIKVLNQRIDQKNAA